MKKHIVVLLMLIVPLVQVTSAAQNQPTSQELVGSPAEQKPKAALAFGLQEGTPVRLRITRTLSSADAQVGETIDFEVLDEVKASETVIIPRGGIAWATVTEAESKRRLGRGGKLNVNIDTVRLASGEKAALRAVKEVKGASQAGVMTGAIVATSLLFFPAAPLFLLMKGKDITIPKGTEITAYINGDTALDPKKFGSALGAADNTSTVASGAVVAAIDVDHSTVTIKSNLEDAEVFVGGRFVGSTPSTLRLRAGDHVITVKKTGYSEWKRSISLNAGGNITLNALLEKAQ